MSCRPNGTILLLAATLAIFWGAGPAMSEPGVPASRLLLLVVGPSGDRIHPQEKRLVEHLRKLREDHQLRALKLGTMHYDRPWERETLNRRLGLFADDGISLALVELTKSGEPLRTLLGKTHLHQGPSSLGNAHKTLLTEWSEQSGRAIPSGLRLKRKSSPDSPPEVSPQGPPRPSTTIYTFEGIRNVILGFDSKLERLWRGIKNRPIRDDRKDLAVRSATYELLEKSRDLRAANQRGVIFPLGQLETVRSKGAQWLGTTPVDFLPPEFAPLIQELTTKLRQLEEIEHQGRQR